MLSYGACPYFRGRRVHVSSKLFAMPYMQDPSYLALVKLYASDLDVLDASFSNAWYKLTTRDMGPYTRSVGPDVPPPQASQLPLPDPPASLSKKYRYKRVMQAIEDIAFSVQSKTEPDTFESQPSYAALFVTLAYQCASTFRITDYAGGCNGARIRLYPQKTWASNVGMDLVRV